MADAWFADTFSNAVVRLASYVVDRHATPRLLFGSVTLLTEKRLRPKSSDRVENLLLDKKNNSKIFYRRVSMTAHQALAWYREASEENLQTPIPSSDAERESKLDGIPISGGPFKDEPSWPTLGMPVDSNIISSNGISNDPAPFAGAGATPPRVHRRFGDNADFEKVVSNDSAVRFLARRINFRLDEYPEYLGSLALIVPNPIVRMVRHSYARNIDGSETLIIRIIPRPSQSLKKLQIIVVETRGNLISRFETIAVPKDGLIAIDEPLPVQQSGYFITHPYYGLLVYQPPLSFMRSCSLSMSIVNRLVNVAAPKTNSPNAESAAYTVHEVSRQLPSTIGEDASAGHLTRVFDASSRRERRNQARRYDQTWLDSNQRDAAIDFMRDRIGRAQRRVIVADPYLGGNDLMRFIHAVNWPDVEVRIITSRLAFDGNSVISRPKRSAASNNKKRKNRPNAIGKNENIAVKQFEAAIKTFEKRNFKNISASVLVGKDPPLHDRFLIVDDAVWLLGNSLNALGMRASLILRVPDPEPIIERILAMEKNSMTFSEYYSQNDASERTRRSNFARQNSVGRKERRSKES